MGFHVHFKKKEEKKRKENGRPLSSEPHQRAFFTGGAWNRQPFFSLFSLSLSLSIFFFAFSEKKNKILGVCPWNGSEMKPRTRFNDRVPKSRIFVLFFFSSFPFFYLFLNIFSLSFLFFYLRRLSERFLDRSLRRKFYVILFLFFFSS